MLANSGADATEAFEEFHFRSTKAHKVLASLPSRKAPPLPESGLYAGSKSDAKVLANFAAFRADLVREGFFERSLLHLAYRLAELAAIFVLGLYLFSLGTPLALGLAVLTHGLFGARCGWLQHEGGHTSLTGNLWLDKRLQAVTIGFGLGACANMWNSMHFKHHATPQKVGHDMDLDTTPLAAFFPTAVEANRARGFSRLWARFQAWTFLPVTSGVFVMGFWLLYLHPREVLRKRLWEQGAWMASSHLVRAALIQQLVGCSALTAYGLFAACMWGV